MQKEIITNKQGITMLILFLFGSTMLIGTGTEAKRDMWLAILLGAAAGAAIMMVYSRLLILYPGKDLFDIILSIFGNIFGKFLCLLFSWYAFHLGALVLRNFGEFMRTLGLSETPMIIPTLVLIFLCIWISKSGIEVLGRWSEFFLLLLYFVIITIQLLVIPKMQLGNLMPVMYNGVRPIIRGAFAAFSFPFAETVVFIGIFNNFKEKKAVKKVFLTGIIFGAITIAIISIRNISVLGPELALRSYFPSYISVSRVDVGEIFQRLEITVAIVFLVSVFVKISVCLITACKGISKVFGSDDYRFIVVPVAALMLNLSLILYKNIQEMVAWARLTYPYYAFPFQVILPAAILITAEIKIRKAKSK